MKDKKTISYLKFRLRMASGELKEAAAEMKKVSVIHASELSGAADMIDQWIDNLKG